MRRFFIRVWHWRVGHEWEFKYNVYGDMIIYHNWNRSVYQCKSCGAEKWCPNLQEGER